VLAAGAAQQVEGRSPQLLAGQVVQRDVHCREGMP
jgi:hypothetical protein